MFDSLRRMVTGVGLITTFTEARGPNVMAAEWTMVVSHSPPLIMVVANRSTATSEMIRESGEFGVSIAADDQGGLVSLAGSFTGHETRKFSSDLIKTLAAKKIRAPLIQGALMHAECRLTQSVDLGEYTGFVGEVVEATHDPEKKPLVYHNGRTWKVQETERPPLLYVTGTYDPTSRQVRAEGRVRPTVSGNVELVLIDSGKRLTSQAHPDQWGFYEHAWKVDGPNGGYVIEAISGEMRASAKIGEEGDKHNYQQR